MSRIVIETTDKEKEALTNKLDEVGKSFKEWFDENLDSTIDHSIPLDESYQLSMATDIKDLLDTQAIKHELESADWSFSGSDTSYLTHDIHPYPAKYIPQIPANVIRRLSLHGDLILDPFGGSGTTATESARLGREAISVDANPLAALLAEVKTTILNKSEKKELSLLHETIRSYLSTEADLPEIDTLREYIPTIPNHEKWFADNVTTELALICKLINEITQNSATKVAKTALSKIIVKVSFQDSETRYVSKPKETKDKSTLKSYLESLKHLRNKLIQFEARVDNPQTTVFMDDSREVLNKKIARESVGLIVTSPPYANATDYHLYHRFRIFWLGFNPKNLADVEIGSHLKHQRKKSGFSEYLEDMTHILEQSFEVLISGRFAVFIVGDSIFKEEVYNTADELTKIAKIIGFEHITTFERPLPEHRRSFAKPARRARGERVLVLKKPLKKLSIEVTKPSYKLWPYEEALLDKEIMTLLKIDENSIEKEKNTRIISIDSSLRNNLSKLTFAKDYAIEGSVSQKTLQSHLETSVSNSSKKESKYVTHGIHTYKGKFYPQLAKSLINIAGIKENSLILDPFCGSGTVLLEAKLNGFKSIGSDLNPLAVKIANAKTNILNLNINDLELSINNLIDYLDTKKDSYTKSTSEFSENLVEDIFSWFPEPVVYKLNFILHQIRLFGDNRIVNFLEVILSECIRNVSQQEPKDLRIRRRAEQLSDAPVFELFCKHLRDSVSKIKLYNKSKSKIQHEIHDSTALIADNRADNFIDLLGVEESSIDLVITSPPYATALPYIDTDRLSLLAILGISTKDTRILERNITGSREIQKKARDEFNSIICNQTDLKNIPTELIDELDFILETNIKTKAGFRKLNTPAVLLRYFIDMEKNLSNVYEVLKKGGLGFYIIGDSKTKVNDEWFPIRSTFWVRKIAENIGFDCELLMDISVTTENLINQKNAITENGILRIKK